MAECFWQDFTRTIEDCEAAVPDIPWSGDFIERAELTGPGGLDEFGKFVAADTDIAMISYWDTSKYDVVVYDNVANVWTEGDTLSESTSMEARGIVGDIAIFSTYDGVDTGGVFVYQLSGGSWTKIQTIWLDNPDSDTIFVEEAHLSPDGLWLAIGARNQTDIATNPGYVELYEWGGSSFSYSSTVNSPDAPAANQYFGKGIAISTDDAGYMFIGAYTNNDEGSNKGAAYVYTLSGSTWSLDETLYRSVSQSAARYGHSIACADNGLRVAIGDRAGGVDYYEEDFGFSNETLLDNGNGAVFNQMDTYGYTGVQTISPFGSNSGVYVYEYDPDTFTWTSRQTLVHGFTIIGGGNFINVMDMDLQGGTLIFSMAEFETGDGELDGQGYVYIYTRDPNVEANPWVGGGGDG